MSLSYQGSTLYFSALILVLLRFAYDEIIGIKQ